MAQQCHKKVRSFIKSARQRHWEATAKLGELMALLTAVDCKWSEVSSGVINEVLERSWFWILRFHPELHSVSLDASGRRAVFGNSNLSNEELVDTGTSEGIGPMYPCERLGWLTFRESAPRRALWWS